jgi:WD40 repeat protein
MSIACSGLRALNVNKIAVTVASVLWCAGALAAQPAPSGKPRVDQLGDPLPAGALFRIGTTRLQLDREIQAIAVSADGKRIAAVSDSLLGVWEVAGGRAILRQRVDPFPDRTPLAPLVALTPDGRGVFTNTMQALRLLETATDKESNLGEEAADAVVAADGKTLTAVQLPTMVLRRFDLARDQVLPKEWVFQQEPTLHEGTVANYAVLFRLSRDGRLLATLESNRASRKQLVRIHDTATGGEIRRWPVDAPPIRQLDFSQDGRFLAAASPDAAGKTEAMACVWEVAIGKELARWKLQGGMSTGRSALAFAPDGASVFGTEAAGVVRWDWRTGKRLQEYPDAGGPIAFLHGGKTLAAQGPLGAIRLIDTATGADQMPLPRAGKHVAVAPNARHVAWSDGGAVVLADGVTGKELRRWPAHERFVGPLVFAPGGKLLASAGTDLRIKLWEIPEGREVRTLVRTGVNALSFSPDGHQLVTSGTGDVCLWDVATGKRTGWWYGKGAAPIMAPDFGTLTLPDRAGRRLRLLEPNGGKELQTLVGYRSVLAYFAAPPLHYLVGIDESPTVFTPLYSPDGRLLLAGADENAESEFALIQPWDVATGRRLPYALRGQEIMLSHIAFAPDSRLLAVQRSDRRLALLNATTGVLVRLLEAGSGSLTTAPVFSPDGRTLITARSVGLLPSAHVVQVWEVATGGEIVRWKGHQDVVRGATLSADGRRLVTMSADHTALVWDLTRLADGKRPVVEACWAELAQLDATRGRRAIEALLASPVQAMALLQKHLRAATVPDAKQLARWIGDLDSDDFDQRQRAETELDRLGEQAAPALRKALDGKPPLETRRRLETLLKKLHNLTLTAEQVRAVRAVQVLENLVTPEARQLLRTLAGGDRESRLTSEAMTALARTAR